MDLRDNPNQSPPYEDWPNRNPKPQNVTLIIDYNLRSLIMCHVPNFGMGHNGLITFSIFMRVFQIDAKGQINAKEENY